MITGLTEKEGRLDLGVLDDAGILNLIREAFAGLERRQNKALAAMWPAENERRAEPEPPRIHVISSFDVYKKDETPNSVSAMEAEKAA